MLEVDPGLLEHLRSEPQADLGRAVGTALDLAGRWGLTLGPALPGATCSLVVRARDRRGRDTVLKVPVIGEEATSGYAAALAFVGHGGIDVWEHDGGSGALLMPLADPGRDLYASGLDDAEALAVAADLFAELRGAPQTNDAPPFIPMRRWFRELFACDASGDGGAMGYVQKLTESLLGSTRETSLLHGDLHHFNILRHGGRWVAIDPKGIVGDPAFEVVAFMRNPIPDLGGWPNLADVQERRLERFAERLGHPVERLWGWSYVETFLSAAWSSGEPWDGWRAASEALRETGVRRGWL